MCKVFRPSAARCPHHKEVCHNRSSHPRHDVIYLKNAEVQSFNGCGYCKWAKTNPPPKSSGYQNPGWPGCCRPPAANEHRMIQAADWPSVSVVHQICIPAEIKALLDSLSSKGNHIPALGANGTRGSPSTPLLNIGNASPPHKPNNTGKTSPMAIPARGRPGGSPKQMMASLTSNNPRASGGNVSTSVPSASSMEQLQIHRRGTHPEFTDKRTESSHSAHSSPNRKNIDLDGSISRRNSGGRTPVKPSTPPMSVAKLSLDDQPTPLRISPKTSPPNARPIDRVSGSVASRAQPKKNSIEISSASSSSGSSDGMGSTTDGTVTSDGGFTDYLSDESEAELQRQAEARAALVAQNHAEEQEFKAARQQLAYVDLRPPKSWNPQSIASASRVSGASSHIPSYTPAIPYSSAPFTSSPMAQAAAHSRG